MKLPLPFTTELRDKLIADVQYKFSNFYVRGFHGNYLCHAISVDEYEELCSFFSTKEFNIAVLTEHLKKKNMIIDLYNKKR